MSEAGNRPLHQGFLYVPPHLALQSEFLAGNQLVKINPKFELQQPLQFMRCAWRRPIHSHMWIPLIRVDSARRAPDSARWGKYVAGPSFPRFTHSGLSPPTHKREAPTSAWAVSRFPCQRDVRPLQALPRGGGAPLAGAGPQEARHVRDLPAGLAADRGAAGASPKVAIEDGMCTGVDMVWSAGQCHPFLPP